MNRRNFSVLAVIILLVIIASSLLLSNPFSSQENEIRERAQTLYPDVLKYGENLKFESIPKPLSELNGTHPRLYLTEERIREIRMLIENDTKYRDIWLREKSLVDKWIDKHPPTFSTLISSADKENEWQRDVGDKIPHYAICYLITRDEKYLEKAKEWILATLTYPVWGECDLSKSQLLYGVSVGYDWIYNNFTLEERERIRERLTLEARYWFLASLGLGDKYEIPQTGWHDNYLQNHMWIALCGLGTAGFALYGEVPDAEIWINQVNNMFKKILRSLGEDGAWHEGVGYWALAMEHFLKYIDLARQLLGEDLFDNPWLRNTAYYRLYNMLPRSMWGNEPRLQNSLDFADCRRCDNRGSDYILRKLASEYRNGYAQWLANEIEESNTGIPDAYWLNLLWYDPSVPAKPPVDLPGMRHFDNLDQVIMRSGWDGDEILFSIKCGPPLGHRGLMMFDYDPGMGHDHPDVNHFVLIAYGEWLIIDDGRADKHLTSRHNTILINGYGQLGEGEESFKRDDRIIVLSEKRTAAIIRAESNPVFDYVIGDAYTMYPDSVGLKKFLRHVIYLKPDIFIIVDELETKTPSTFQWLLHCEGELSKTDENTFTLKNGNVDLMIKIILPNEHESKIYNTMFYFEHERGTKTKKIKKEEVPTLEISPKQDVNRTVFLVVLHPAKAGETHPVIREISEDGNMGLLIRDEQKEKEVKIFFNFTRQKRNERIFRILGVEELEDTYNYVRELPPLMSSTES